jgi:hypothetical protein
MKRVPEVLPSGESVAVRPALLTVAAVAAYCGCSASLLNALRAKDAAALQHGGAVTGPAWVRTPAGIRYRLGDVDAWIERTSIPFGVMDSKRRNPPAVAHPAQEASR